MLGITYYHIFIKHLVLYVFSYIFSSCLRLYIYDLSYQVCLITTNNLPKSRFYEGPLECLPYNSALTVIAPIDIKDEYNQCPFTVPNNTL